MSFIEQVQNGTHDTILHSEQILAQVMVIVKGDNVLVAFSRPHSIDVAIHSLEGKEQS